MAQGYKNEDMPLVELCQHMYVAFGIHAVVTFIAERQEAGYLSDITWRDCNGCDWNTPIDTDGTCLVCGFNE